MPRHLCILSNNFPFGEEFPSVANIGQLKYWFHILAGTLFKFRRLVEPIIVAQKGHGPATFSRRWRF